MWEADVANFRSGTAVVRKERKSPIKVVGAKKVVVMKHPCKQEKGKRRMGRQTKKLGDGRRMWKGRNKVKEM